MTKQTHDTSTPEGRAALMSEVCNKVQDNFLYLHSRWQDERWHEEWSDYATAIDEVVTTKIEGARIIKRGRKGSFAVHVSIPGMPYHVKLGIWRGAFGWESLPR